jgi:hypothetical protein
MIAVNMGIGPRIMLRSGGWFDFLDPWNSPFTIEDIAHGLAHVCRYAGQCSGFYSVAEHSLLVADVVDDYPLEALLHDAAEAFMGDITRPLKQLLPEYKRVEANVEGAILERLGLSTPIPKAVKDADLRVLAAEQLQIMPKGTADWAHEQGVVPAPVVVRLLPPEAAFHEFMERYHALSRLVGTSPERRDRLTPSGLCG